MVRKRRMCARKRMEEWMDGWMDWQKRTTTHTWRFVAFCVCSCCCCCPSWRRRSGGPSPGCAPLRLTRPEEVVTDASRFIGNIRKERACKRRSLFFSFSSLLLCVWLCVAPTITADDVIWIHPGNGPQTNTHTHTQNGIRKKKEKKVEWICCSLTFDLH